MKKMKTVDEYIINNENWQKELILLRDICLSTGMEETIKWGGPVFTLNGKNIVGLGAFKTYVSIWFFQGALLKDKESMLINAQEGKTNALRQWRFKKSHEINIDLVSDYIMEAIDNHKKGKEIKSIKNKVLVIPKELASELKKSPVLKLAYDKFSLSKQREFAEYITDAKRLETKIKRLDKIIPMIQESKGLNDKYRQ